MTRYFAPVTGISGELQFATANCAGRERILEE